ncbi:hypothetical protein [Methanogenium organophilum]|uniref:Uncharacterized protein n=1 Tax=Methanogenium organophilum TaxID=2199 RepID=A0A9X9T924_METOG|nr:hypothetical protein [Methanogenium organophilum]WAI01722.1 hypothetical protein OU421_02290 [Methanogenium organophilum]
MENKEVTDQAYNQTIEMIREYAEKYPDDEFVTANQHILGGVTETWSCGGPIEMSGFLWWAYSAQVICDISQMKGFIFSATGGPDTCVSAFAGPLFGKFAVDPRTIKDGKYRFSLTMGGTGAGSVTLSLYEMNKKYLGTLSGVIAGAGMCNISGTGKITH